MHIWYTCWNIRFHQPNGSAVYNRERLLKCRYLNIQKLNIYTFKMKMSLIRMVKAVVRAWWLLLIIHNNIDTPLMPFYWMCDTDVQQGKCLFEYFATCQHENGCCPFNDEVEAIRTKQLNTITVDALPSCVARRSTVMILTSNEKGNGDVSLNVSLITHARVEKL